MKWMTLFGFFSESVALIANLADHNRSGLFIYELVLWPILGMMAAWAFAGKGNGHDSETHGTNR